MKTKEKWIALILVCIFIMMSFSTVVFADIDLSGMNYDELVALKDQINLAIWNSEEWQEVEVPQGVWQVGSDIPAGKWTIKCADHAGSYMMKEADISWGDTLDESGHNISWSGRFDMATIYNSNHEDYRDGQVTEITIEVQEGDYVVIDEAYNSVIFTPYSGKPSLGFK